LKQGAKQGGLDLKGAYLNLDGGCDSAHNRKGIFHAGLIPNIPENLRNRKPPKRGRKRLFNTVIHELRLQGIRLTRDTASPQSLTARA
jgi:hypothetical protein